MEQYNATLAEQEGVALQEIASKGMPPNPGCRAVNQAGLGGSSARYRREPSDAPCTRRGAGSRAR
jgi:hypothetical protein